MTAATPSAQSTAWQVFLGACFNSLQLTMPRADLKTNSHAAGRQSQGHKHYRLRFF